MMMIYCYWDIWTGLLGFRCFPFSQEIISTWIKTYFYHRDNDSSCCLFQSMQHRFGLRRCIYQKRWIIFIVCIRNSFYRVTPASYSFPSFFSEKLFPFIRSVDDRTTSTKMLTSVLNSVYIFIKTFHSVSDLTDKDLENILNLKKKYIGGRYSSYSL